MTVFTSLIGKNLLLKRRNLKGSLCELLVPILCVLALFLIDPSRDLFNTEFTDGWVDADSNTQLSANTAVLQSFDLGSILIGADNMRLLIQNRGGTEETAAIDLFINFLAAASPFDFQLGTEDSFVVVLDENFDATTLTTINFDGINSIEEYVDQDDYILEDFAPDVLEVIGLIEIDDMNFDTAKLSYSIRMASKSDFDTDFSAFTAPRSNFSPLVSGRGVHVTDMAEYAVNGFSAFQNAIDSFFILEVNKVARNDQTLTLGDVLTPNVAFFVPYAADGFTINDFFSNAQVIIGFFFVLAFSGPFSQLTFLLVREKEVRAKEYLHICGVTDNMILLSWGATYAMYYFVISIVMTGFTNRVFFNSSVVYIFLVYFLFGLALIPLSCIISALFRKGNNGASTAVLANFGLFFLQIAFDEPNVLNVIPHVNFAFIIQNIAEFETDFRGLTSDTMDVEVDGFSVAEGFLNFLVSILLWSAVAMYLNNVLPTATEAPLNWDYIIQKAYWFNSVQPLDLAGEKTDAAVDFDTPIENENFEKVGENLKTQMKDGKGIQIRGLKKHFPAQDGTVMAVNGVDLDIFEGQILSYCGHNGSGKTTTLRLLSGSYQPTAGDARIYGQTITGNINSIRNSLGFCPQENLLYPELTVAEHLRFYLKLKGIGSSDVEDSVKEAAAQVGLTDKLDVASKGLSGGMKRRLSLAISLVGDSKVVFVDEPTSGVDPWNRRSIWDILRNCKNDRVIILTTHFMDEAEILGDRIAILSEGQVKCCGSSLFLKKRFGAGYQLTCIKANKTEGKTKTEDIVMKHIEKASIFAEEASEMLFYLPSSQSHKFATLFDELDKMILDESLDVTSYGISGSTLEEVFLKVGQSTDLKMGVKRFKSDPLLLQSDENKEELNDDKVKLNDPENVGKPSKYLLVQIESLFLKRVRYARHDLTAMFCGTVLPLVLVLVSFILMTTDSTSISVASLNDLSLQDNFPDVTSFIVKTIEYDESNAPLPAGAGRMEQPELFPQFELDSISRDISTSLVDDVTVFGSNESVFSFEQKVAYLLSETIFDANLRIENEPIVLAFFDQDNSYDMFFNTEYRHAVPVITTIVNNAYLAASLPDDATVEPEISATSFSFVVRTDVEILVESINLLLYGILFIFAMCFIPAPIIAYNVMENEPKIEFRSMQLISGANSLSYWLSNFMFDAVGSTLFVIGVLILAFAFNVPVIKEDLTIFGAIAMFILASIPFSYILGNFFSTAGNAQLFMIILSSMAGVIMAFTIYIMVLVQQFDRLEPYMYLLRLIPIVSFTEYFIYVYFEFNVSEGVLPVSFFDGVDFEELKGIDLAYLGAEIVVYFCLIMLSHFLTTDGNIGQKINLLRLKLTLANTTITNDSITDDDVLKEKERVYSASKDSDVLQVKGIEKIYPGGFPALKGVSFGMSKGECFGYLGVNGSGKTTTIRCLVGDLFATNGTAEISGLDVATEQNSIRQVIGFCSQFGSLLAPLTVREHLELFCNLKYPALHADQLRRGENLGRKELVEKQVMQLIGRLSLTPFENKKSGNLSGGNKRKLSVAIAMIGSPSIMLLDEPSTGMDVASRRFMWNIIQDMRTGKFSSRKTSIVLTTHSMEECEALCSRVGILNQGQFAAIGSIQHLKEKFGTGYVLDVRFNTVEAKTVEDFVEKAGGDRVIELSNIKGILREIELSSTLDHLLQSQSTSTIQNLSLRVKQSATGDMSVQLKSLVEWALQQQAILDFFTFLGENFIKAKVELIEERDAQVKLKLDTSYKDTRLGQIFGSLETNKGMLNLLEYSISQTTLEQIFNNIAQANADEDDRNVTGSARRCRCCGSTKGTTTTQSDNAIKLAKIRAVLSEN